MDLVTWEFMDGKLEVRDGNHCMKFPYNIETGALWADAAEAEAWAQAKYDPINAERSSSIEPLIDVFLHIDITDGDGDPPGIVNDGTDALTVTATLRETSDPASAVIPMTDTWRIPLRGSAGQVYDLIKINMTDGVVAFFYKTTGAPDIISIQEADLTIIEFGGVKYRITIVGNAVINVFRDFTA